MDRRIAQAEVGRDVERAPPVGEDVAHEGSGRAVRERAEDQLGVRLAPAFWRRQRLIDDALEERIDLRSAAIAVLLRGEERDLDVRVPAQEAEQLDTRVARGTEHRDGDAPRGGGGLLAHSPHGGVVYATHRAGATQAATTSPSSPAVSACLFGGPVASPLDPRYRFEYCGRLRAL